METYMNIEKVNVQTKTTNCGGFSTFEKEAEASLDYWWRNQTDFGAVCNLAETVLDMAKELDRLKAIVDAMPEDGL